MVLLHGVRTGLFLPVGCLLPGWLLGRTAASPPDSSAPLSAPPLFCRTSCSSSMPAVCPSPPCISAPLLPLSVRRSPSSPRTRPRPRPRTRRPCAPRDPRSAVGFRHPIPLGLSRLRYAPRGLAAILAPRCPRKISGTEPGPTASRRSWPHSSSGADSPSAKPPNGSPPPSSSARPPSFF